ncbi:hypothetical protein D9M69_627700 [compost metagenome]
MRGLQRAARRIPPGQQHLALPAARLHRGGHIGQAGDDPDAIGFVPGGLQLVTHSLQQQHTDHQQRHQQHRTQQRQFGG